MPQCSHFYVTCVVTRILCWSPEQFLLKSIDMKSSWMVFSFARVAAQNAGDGRTCTSAAHYCAERGKNGRVRSPQVGWRHLRKIWLVCKTSVAVPWQGRRCDPFRPHKLLVPQGCPPHADAVGPQGCKHVHFEGFQGWKGHLACGSRLAKRRHLGSRWMKSSAFLRYCQADDEREIRNSSSFDEENRGLRANDQMVKMGCRQEKIWGMWIWMCVPWYHRLCDKHVDEGATRCCIWEQCSQLPCTTYGDLDLEIRTLSANVMESAAWIEVTRPWFLLHTYCEHWKCVNRRLPCCRGMVWSHDCHHATVTWPLFE